MSKDDQHLDKVREVFVEYFRESDLVILPAYRGYLAAGKTRKMGHPLVMWLHKANIEGLSKIVITTAVERSLDAIASFIPFGTTGYTILRDTLRVKMPRDVYTFVPDTHYVETGSLTISADGEVFEGPIGGALMLTRRTLTTVKKTVSSGVKELLNLTGITKKDETSGRSQTELDANAKEINMIIIRFPPKFLRRYLSEASKSLSETAKTFLHSIPVPEFKITDANGARAFLHGVKKLGFEVENSPVFRPLSLPSVFGANIDGENKE